MNAPLTKDKIFPWQVADSLRTKEDTVTVDDVRSAVEGLREDVCEYSYCCGSELRGKKRYCTSCTILFKWFPAFKEKEEQ